MSDRYGYTAVAVANKPIEVIGYQIVDRVKGDVIAHASGEVVTRQIVEALNAAEDLKLAFRIILGRK